jgi:hypothetical protein
MKVLSIDVGIKNLALCLMNVNEDKKYSIDLWNVANLCREEKIVCVTCKKPAKYKYGLFYSCKKHIKDSGVNIIPTELESNKLKKGKIKDIREILIKHEIQFDHKKSKILLLDELQKEFESKYVIPFNNSIKTTDMTLIEIGINLKIEMDLLFKDIKIDTVIIENQISPIANRMKTLQGMIAQYFIMKDVNDIHFISASNKLKEFMPNKQTTYSERKKKGIEVCEELLITNEKISEHVALFENSKKKDDLADCFLQGLWFLKEKLLIDENI